MDSTPALDRPLETEIRDKWISLFSHPDITIEDLQQQALLPAGLGHDEDDQGGVTLRSVYWRIYLGILPLEALQAGSSTHLRTHLRSQRRNYDQRREKWLKAPDGRWASDCSIPHGEFGSGSTNAGSDTWDPLNLGDENPWQAWFANAELRKTIEKDVERTFPDIPYFGNVTVRKILTTILFLWAIENEEVGYRQGMHELLGTILMVCDRDSLPQSSGSSVDITFSPLQEGSSPSSARLEESMKLVLDRGFVEHDAYSLFCRLMETGKDWYEWRTEAVGVTRVQRRAKIIDLCEHMQDDILKKVDPILQAKLAAEGVEGQLWGIRYVRLLFTREMPLASAMRIWDGIFAEEVRMDQVIVHVCITLLLRIRHLLLPSDYPGVLTLLLKYPQASPELPLSPALLLSQALTVLKNPSPSAGAAVTLQNQESLGIPAYAPDGTETTPSLMHTQTLRSRQKTAPAASNRSLPAASRTYGFESIARGLMEKAQASGFDRTIISTVSEFRKNLPDFNTQTAPTFPFRNFTTEAVPESLLSDDALPAHKPPPLQRVRTLLDAEREIAELRLSMIGMGKAMGTWLDLVNPPSNTTEANQPIINNGNDQSASAWTGMKRLQESLLDGGAAPTSDLARVWAWSQDLQSTSLSNVTDLANGPGTAHTAHEDQHSDPFAKHTPVISHVEVPSYQPSSATSASFDSPRFHRPTTSIHSLNSPRNLDNYTSPSFPPSGFGNKRTSQTFHPTHSQVYAPPAKQAAPNLYLTPDSPPDMPFKMAKSADYEETFDMQPAKKANVDPLLGLGI